MGATKANAAVPTISTESDSTVETTETDSVVESVKTDFTDESAVSTEYANSDQKGKAAIRSELRKLIETVTRDAMDKMLKGDESAASDALEAKRLNALNDSLRSTPAKSTIVVDYVRIVAERLASLRIAAKALETDIAAFLPEGVDCDIEAVMRNADELFNLPDSDVPDQMVKQVVSYTTLKFGNSDQRDIAAHIGEWAQSVPSGTFATVQDIRNFRSNEYGTDKPSPGAIAARLFPQNDRKCTLTTVTPVERTATQSRGARTV